MARDSSSLVSVALRHVRDAEFLLDSAHGRASIDQAYHLAGFGPECARKATLTVDWFDKAIGHRMDPGIEDLLTTAIALDHIAARYDIHSWPSRYPALAKWKEESLVESTP